MKRVKIYKILSYSAILFFYLILFSGCASTVKQYSEYSPSISADGRTMIFQADIKKRGDYKIYIKQKILGKWSESILIQSVNSQYADGGCFITYDQNYLILSSNRIGGLGSTDLWISRRNGENWSVPINMGAPINSSGYEGFASLSPDGKTLYFVREAPDKAMCKKDKLGIFSSEKINGKWSEPKMLPAPINSNYCEFGPIILADNITLIFSSTRPGGFGDYDLYKSEKTEDGGWSRPINLGSFINTTHEDSLIAIPASGDIMYYTKIINGDVQNQNSGVRRIVNSPIPEKLQQTKVVIVKGTVRDRRNPDKTLFAELSITDIKKDAKPIITNSNKDDGKYIVILNKGRVCDFSVKSKGYLFNSKKIDLTVLKKYKEINEDIFLEPLVVGAKIVLHNMYFKIRSYKLLKESKYELNRVIQLIKENPSMKVEISGHTDKMGSWRYNRRLSNKRAQAVVKYLINKGIAKNRLVAKGYAWKRPVADNNTEENRKKNRRVEIEILHLD